MRRFLLRGGRVVVHTVVGGVLLAAGLVMLATPGPGIVTVVLGLAVLAREYDWADRLGRTVLGRVRDASTAARVRVASRRRERSPDETVTDLPRGAAPRPDGGGDPQGGVRSAS